MKMRRWRLLPADGQIGWLPYVWLVYLGSFLAQPVMRWRTGRLGLAEALMTGAALALFLLSYFRGFWVNGPEILRVIGMQVLLGAVMMPLNPSAFVFFVYAASFASRLGSDRAAVRGIGAIAGIALAAAVLSGAPLAYMIAGPGLAIIIGAANLQQAQVRRANESLLIARDQVQRLAAVAERERIARDLHDILGHTLSLIVLKSELAAKLAPRDADRAAREMRDVEEVSRKALQQVRETIRGYRATLADEVAQSHTLLDAAGIRSAFHTEPAELDRAAEEALALALREAVTNVVRHSRAQSCRVSLRAKGGWCILEVEDDGRGGSAPEGSGLRGMRERVAALDGVMLRARGAEGRGTRLEVMVPARQPAEAAP
jgi:two-component system sensor histidine kinase DesK